MKLFLLLFLSLLLTACASGPEVKGGGEDAFQIAKTKGRAYLERGVPAMALPALRKARELQPDDSEVLLMLGLAYDQVARPMQSLEALQYAHQLRPMEGRINNNLGVALLRLDRYDEARIAFEAALTDVSFPNPEEVYFNLALLYKRQGSQREMVVMLEKAIQTKIGFVPALLELAVFHRDMGRFELEQKQLLLVLEEMPDHLVAMERLADSYLKMEKSQEARVLLLKIQSVDARSQAAQRAQEKLAAMEQLP